MTRDNLVQPLRLGGALAVLTASFLPAQNNVLVIVGDDIGVDKVGAYREGHKPPPTPTLDALARRGVLFRNAYSNAVCSPTRACIHTGQYAFRTLIGSAIPIGNPATLQESAVTLPEVLDRAKSGYRHAAIGKWHLGPARGDEDHPRRVGGWSHFAGMLPGATTDYYNWPRTVDGSTQTSTTYTTTQMVDDALAWIRGQNGPWVCYLAFNAPHTPFHAPPANLHTQDLTGKDPDQQPIPFYTAMVEAMDAEIGRLLAGLGSSLDRTNVVFLGDNGTFEPVIEAPFPSDHGKATPYEGGTNVPLIVAGPAVASGGREVTALVGAVDLFATVLELAGVDARASVPAWVPLDSISFAPYLADPNRSPLRQTIATEQFTGDSWPRPERNGFATLRNDRYKLIRLFRVAQPPTEQLYDLLVDPFEQSDLLLGSLTTEQQLARDSLRAELDALRTRTAAVYRYGATDCVGSNGRPTIGVTGSPVIGTTYRVLVQNGPRRSSAVLLSGLSAETWAPLVLPFPLTTLGGGAGCYVLASGDVLTPVSTDAAGAASIPVALPSDRSLVGWTVFHGWLLTDPSAPANPLGITASDGLAALLGDR
ncbi:MAG: sulfatase-like hydrolase/transferase [Planctomycetes bacterium]|nr:sulfatase-like hydrolase/transferase [Planctomycetota bacterium]